MNAVLYDHLGRPVQKAVLGRELAAPSMTGVRSLWDTSVAAGLTPARLAALLAAAAAGDAFDYLTLAEEMEERDPHYACELSKRKLAVASLPITVESATDAATDKKLADAVRNLVRRPGFRGLLKDLLDGLGKGYSVVEIIWSRGQTWTPERYAWRDPRFFRFDLETRDQLRLLDEADLYAGLPLAPCKFIVHRPHLKSGCTIRGGLARLAAWAWMCKNYTVKDWMAFAEVYGMPLRIGKFHSGAAAADIDILKMAVGSLGSDAAAVIPESMLIELVERKTTGEPVFKALADWLDTQVSRAILGQSATTAGTPGKLGNEESQAEVRRDIRDDDAAQLAETLGMHLVQPYIDLNYGPQENYPRLILAETAGEDITVLAATLAKLVPLGLEVEQSVVRDRLGWPDPAPGAQLLRQQKIQNSEVRSQNSVWQELPAPMSERGRGEEVAMNRSIQSTFTPEQQALENLAKLALAGVDLSANEALLQAAIEGASSYEDAIERLLATWPDLSMDTLTALLEQSLLAAAIFGQVQAGEGEQ